MNKTIRIGTRGSKLALWQARNLEQKLANIGTNTELVIIKTRGDQIQHLGFDKMEGKGFFTKEIEESLKSGEIDIAVHSLKDLPTQSPEGLIIGGLSEREDPSDWMLIRSGAFDPKGSLRVKVGSSIGTSSVRRKVQLLNLDHRVNTVDIRGNVPTRVAKLAAGEVDAIVLAAAGLIRLDIDLSPFHIVRFQVSEFVPAPGQGVIAYQIRAQETELRNTVKRIHHRETSIATNVERQVLKLMEGGCQLPLGVHCQIDGNGNFHTYSVFAPTVEDKLTRFQLSQSSSVGLVSKIVESIKNPASY